MVRPYWVTAGPVSLNRHAGSRLRRRNDRCGQGRTSSSRRSSHPSPSGPAFTTPRLERGFWFFRFLLRALRFRVAVSLNGLNPSLPASFAGRTTSSCSLYSSVGMFGIVIADSPIKEPGEAGTRADQFFPTEAALLRRAQAGMERPRRFRFHRIGGDGDNVDIRALSTFERANVPAP